MRRFYVENIGTTPSYLIIKGDQARHIRTVLRLKVSDSIILFDGKGSEYNAAITELHPGFVKVQIIERITPIDESPLKITMGQGIMKFKKMDLIVQKATELGITSIIPFISSRAIPKRKGDLGMRKVERWRNIAIESLKQCGRAVPPYIGDIVSFDDLLRQSTEVPLKLIFWENAQRGKLPEILRSHSKTKEVIALIGPEGGFTQREVDRAQAHKFIPVKAGDRLLRAETAAIAFMSIIQYELGDLG